MNTPHTVLASLAALSPLLMSSTAGGPAVDDNPHLLRPRTKSVSVFKNGLGFFVTEGRATKRDGWVVAEKIPPAKFGTLLIYSRGAGETVDVVGSGPGEIVAFDGVDAPADEAYKRARLLSARMLKVEFAYQENRQERRAAGQLISVGPEFAILDTGQHRVAVPIAAIERMQMLDLPLRIHVASESDAPSDESDIGIAYLAGGITWIPEYSLRVLDEQNAELTLRGTLINEAEDLVHCDVNFVVGVPHFAHADKLAPIAVGQMIRSIATAVAPPGLQSQIMSRAAITQNAPAPFTAPEPTVVERPADVATGDLSRTTAGLPRLAGPGGSDFSVYTKRDMTVRRGERAIVTLFKQRIRYSHVYRWSPPEKMQHHLVLHNETDAAWTTGPYLALSGERPLSEDILRYTPSGSRCEVPVTTSVDVSHDQRESESGRELKAYSPSHNRHFDLVTLRGELRLRNHEERPVDVRIRARVPGKALQASDDGELRVDSRKLELLKRESVIEWRVTLEPGAAKILRYSYDRYVPSA